MYTTNNEPFRTNRILYFSSPTLTDPIVFFYFFNIFSLSQNVFIAPKSITNRRNIENVIEGWTTAAKHFNGYWVLKWKNGLMP